MTARAGGFTLIEVLVALGIVAVALVGGLQATMALGNNAQTFIAFPNKTGIIFSSNRPTASTKGSDTSLPGNSRFNVFLVTDFAINPNLTNFLSLPI